MEIVPKLCGKAINQCGFRCVKQNIDQRQRQFQFGSISVSLIIGDVQSKLPNWEGKADAWFLDGFSPAKNPEMWCEKVMAGVGTHTNAKGTFATFTAAGHVRRALEAVGFDVMRTPGFGRKRHMSRGVLR